MDKISVILVDDHPLILEGLKKILDMETDIDVVGVAYDGVEAIKIVEEHKPQVLLLDINMPRLGGIEACSEIREKVPETKIIALTVCYEEDKILEILRVGAKGYFLKDVEPERLVDAVRNVMKGHSFIHPRVADISEQEDRDLSNHDLTIREIEIIKKITEGLTNKEIAENLFISEKTVKNHITNILRKLDLRDRTQAALWAIKQKIV